MDWQPEQIKPEPYKTVLLRLAGGSNEYTTGWWADKALRLRSGEPYQGKGCWIGLALNQSPPTYELEAWAVTHWCEIVGPGE